MGLDDTPAEAIPAAPDDDAQAKVLLVDDREDKLLAIGAVLAPLRAMVITARSGKEALRLVLQHEFAVILLDVSMPIMDGFEAAALIRQRKASERTPIIFITAMSATDNHATRGYSLGAVDYIYAPVLPDVLRAKVSVFIDLFERSREIRRQADWLRVEAERRATNLETRLDGLLNRLNVGVFRCTIEGQLISANPAFRRIFGIAAGADLTAINIASLYQQTEERSAIVARLEREGRIQDHHVRQRRVDGTVIWASLSKTLVAETGAGRWIDGLVEDITTRKEAEAALIAKSEELARSNAELEEFAYIASHDLQEPLRMVASYSSLVADRYAAVLDDKGRVFLGHLVEGAKRMQSLVRDILAYSKVGKSNAAQEVDCEVLIEKVLYNLQQNIEDSGAEVQRVRLPTVVGDPVLIGQVFQNLIGNALKFRAKDARPVIVIGVDRSEREWRFSVADNGIGIAPEYHERIFRVFQRLHTATEYAGTGIGLAICRKAIEHHGGSITLVSEVGRGATFTFAIPLAVMGAGAQGTKSA
jgi:PAS domain S-box-containing protein